MIKINLATNKQNTSGGMGGFGGFSQFPQINLEFLKQIPIMRIALPIIVVTLGSHMLENFKEEEVKTVQESIEKLKAQNAKIQVEINKSKDYEILKKQFDEDEKVVRTKLDTIRSLMADRAHPPKMLLTIAQVIPDKVWLTSFKVENTGIVLTGSSLGFAPISDFLKSLGESAYFSDLELKKISKEEKGSDKDINQFEILAKRGGK